MLPPSVGAGQEILKAREKSFLLTLKDMDTRVLEKILGEHTKTSVFGAQGLFELASEMSGIDAVQKILGKIVGEETKRQTSEAGGAFGKWLSKKIGGEETLKTPETPGL